jgi:hypothetical protein
VRERGYSMKTTSSPQPFSSIVPLEAREQALCAFKEEFCLTPRPPRGLIRPAFLSLHAEDSSNKLGGFELMAIAAIRLVSVTQV